MIASATTWLKKRLELPEVRGFDRDAPELIGIHRRIIFEKAFLRNIYREHYAAFAGALEGLPPGPVIEIGSGGGFIKEQMPHVVTTDLHAEPHLDKVMSAERIDFPNDSIAAILMLNVFHHLPDPRIFLKETQRTLMPGGRAVLIEPAHTWLWSRLYRLFSAEPYDENAADWGFPATGRFSGANVPQAWIVFQRDRAIFEREFPDLRLRSVGHHTAFLYALSGGIWFRAVVPDWSFGFFRRVEKLLSPAMRWLAGQTTFVLQKR